MAKQKILIVDDDAHIAELISLYLIKECFETKTVEDGESALLAFHSFHPDLILLDLMLPGLSGEDVLPHIRNIPVIVLSAKADVQDKVSLLLGGASDYLTKPFHTEELLARIAVQLRKAEKTEDSSLLTAGDLTLDTVSLEAAVKGSPAKLTRTEFAILKLLMSNPGRAISKSVLLDRISLDTPDCTERSLKQHISNLRKKLLEAGGTDYIETVWGIGFRLR